jgi:hypothetical protein
VAPGGAVGTRHSVEPEPEATASSQRMVNTAQGLTRYGPCQRESGWGYLQE